MFKKLFAALAVALCLSVGTVSAQYVPINAELPVQTGQSGKCLTTNGSNVGWNACTTSANVPTPSATGQLLYTSNGSTWQVLAIGTSGQCLLSNGSPLIPTWANCANGTVTSVGLSMPTEFSVGSSPITSTGTIAVSKVSQLANLAYLSPNGSSGVPSFRALVANDIPSLPYVSSTASQMANTFLGAPNGSSGSPAFRSLVLADLPTINFANLAGSATVAQAGTGITSYTTGDILYASAPGVLSKLSIGSSGQVLTVSSGLPSWTVGSGGASLSGNNLWTGTNTYQGIVTVTGGEFDIGDGVSSGGSQNMKLGADLHFFDVASGTGGGLDCSTNSTQTFGGVTGYALSCYDPGHAFAPILFVDDAPHGGDMALKGGLVTNGATNSVIAYPWHNSSAPTCTVGAGGTSCSTTVTLPHSGMDCAANLDGTTLLGGLVGEVLVNISGTTETLTYATPTLAGGGTVNFHNVCN